MKSLVALLLAFNLNTVTTEQLQRIPGVGPALAKRIVEFREKKGGFTRVEELLAIPGISEKKWRVLRDYLSLPPLPPPNIPPKTFPMPLKTLPTPLPASTTPFSIVSEIVGL